MFLKIRTKNIHSQIKIDCEVYEGDELFPLVNLEYAFYLSENGKKQLSQWYTKKNYVSFDLEGVNGNSELSFTVFIKFNNTKIIITQPILPEKNLFVCHLDNDFNCVKTDIYDYCNNEEPFFSLPAPYLDFSLVSISQYNKGIIDKLILSLRKFNLELSLFEHGNGSATIIISSDNTRINLDKQTHKAFAISGIYKNNDGNKVEIAKGNPSFSLLSNIDAEAGLYEYFYLENEVVSFKTDIFGFGKLFYSSHESMAIVSNRMHLHKIVMSYLGIEIKPNQVAINTMLFSEDSFFTHQNTLTESVIRGVYLLPLGKDIQLQNGKILLSNNIRFKESFSSEVSYEVLVERAVNKIISNAEAIINTQDFDRVVMDLSGGKDSRLVLGAILNNEKRSEVELYTKDIVSNDDLAIACGLANLFGMRFYDGDTGSQYPLTIRENINIWRSYFTGAYNRFAAGTWSNKGRNKESVTVSGGNGEVFREPWTHPRKRLALFDKYNNNIDDFCNAFVVSVATPGLYSNKELSEIAESLSLELDSLPGATSREKFENHYLFHRNRYHFGMRGFSSYHDKMTWMPLQSLDFFAASRILGDQDRLDGKILVDVFNKLDPILMRVRFDEKADIFSLSTLKETRNPELFLDESTDKWKLSREKQQDRLGKRRKEENSLMDWKDLDDVLQNEVLSLLNSKKFSIPDKIRENFLRDWELDKSKSRNLAARIMAIFDLCTDINK